MQLERTISQLDIGWVPEDRAIEMGHLGFMQWMGGLPGHMNYPVAALHALTVAGPFMESSPAVAVFADLVMESLNRGPMPLDLKLPEPQRRGGAQARRGAH